VDGLELCGGLYTETSESEACFRDRVSQFRRSKKGRDRQILIPAIQAAVRLISPPITGPTCVPGFLPLKLGNSKQMDIASTSCY